MPKFLIQTYMSDRKMTIKWDKKLSFYDSLRICFSSHGTDLFLCLSGSRRRVRPKIRHLAPLDECACAFKKMSLRRTKSTMAHMTWFRLRQRESIIGVHWRQMKIPTRGFTVQMGNEVCMRLNISTLV